MESLELLQTSALAIFIATLIAGLVEVIKRALKPWHIPEEKQDAIYPLLALALGVLASWLVFTVVNFPDRRPEMIVLAGLVTGLLSSGIWTQVSAYVRSQKAPSPEDRLERVAPPGG